MIASRKPEGYDYWFTILTATYNRAYLLPRVFNSLCQQTFQDFEWVVVDDGSVDETADMMKRLAIEGSFPIRYYHQPNGGKHTAVNRGVQRARGFLIAILDDDDWLVPEALERCAESWQSIPDDQRDRFVGVTGLCRMPDGALSGSLFPKDVLDSDPLELRLKGWIKGERWGVQRAAVLREFPFPTDLGPFVTESLVWNRIATKYRTRYINQELAVIEFQAGGLTASSARNRARSPRAAAQYYRELIASERKVTFDVKLRNYINFVRFSTHAGVTWTQQMKSVPSTFFWLISLPIGVTCYLYDRRFT